MNKIVALSTLVILIIGIYYASGQKSPEIISQEVREQLNEHSTNKSQVRNEEGLNTSKTTKSATLNNLKGLKDNKAQNRPKALKENNIEGADELRVKIVKNNQIYKNHLIQIKSFDNKTKNYHVVLKSKDKQRPTSFSARIDINGKILKTWGSSLYEDYNGAPVRFGIPQE